MTLFLNRVFLCKFDFKLTFKSKFGKINLEGMDVMLCGEYF